MTRLVYCLWLLVYGHYRINNSDNHCRLSYQKKTKRWRSVVIYEPTNSTQHPTQALSRYFKGTSLEGSDFRGCNIFRPGSVPPCAVIFLGRASRRDKQAAWETLWSSRLGIPFCFCLLKDLTPSFSVVSVLQFIAEQFRGVCVDRAGALQILRASDSSSVVFQRI